MSRAKGRVHPEELDPVLAHYHFERVTVGMSAAAVWRCTREGAPTLYLKTAQTGAAMALDGEAARLEWMRASGLPVPAVHAYLRTGDAEYLLLDEVDGVDASDQRWQSVAARVIAALAAGLRRLHQTSIAECPFDQRVAGQIEEARARMETGRVDTDDFDEIRTGRSVSDLFAELVATRPSGEDLAFTHGDYCVPNIILRQPEPGGDVTVAGFVDCGRAGVADRHQDLALAARSITYNFGEQWVAPFFKLYGDPAPDPEKLAFYTLLDEFF